jgi:hypothetical protein
VEKIQIELRNEMEPNRLDQIRMQVQDATSDVRKPHIIDTPYRGIRTSFFVYHPKLNPNIVTAFDEALKVFHAQLQAHINVAEMYNGEMTRHEAVLPKDTLKGIKQLLIEIEAKRDVYILEALAEALWDKEGANQDAAGNFEGESEKTDKHFLPFFADLEERAKVIRAEDFGLTVGRTFGKADIIKRSWVG